MQLLINAVVAAVQWNPDPVLFHLGSLGIRYYSLLFVAGFVLGYYIEQRMFKREGLDVKMVDSLLLYVMIATIIGARLGHCIFYDWAYYKDHIMEMILPIRTMPNGSIKFIGYQGLASHGAAIGIIIALWFYSKKISHRSILWILDRVVVPVALAGCFIRLGNLMNSEIIGAPTGGNWGFMFMRADVSDPATPRHPAQLYEAVCYLITFGVLIYLFFKSKTRDWHGFLFGLFLVMIFVARFFIEFVKENQVDFEQGMQLNMGQWLSLPFILVGVAAIWYATSRRHITMAAAAKKRH